MILAASGIDKLVLAIIQGVPAGSVFALIAIGFVLTYKTSGVFNLVFGAQAFVSAAAYFELHTRRGWPIWSAALLSIVVLAPLLGLALERLVFRNLRTASPVAKLVAAVGLMVAVPELFKILINFDRSPSFGAVGLVPDGQHVYQLFGRYPVTRDEIVQFLVALIGAAVLAALFRFTHVGLRMRAVVESPRMAELKGVNAERISSMSWALSSLYAGLAGVLLAPRFVTIQPSFFFGLVMVAIAAAALGRLVSLPWALAGGMLLGVVNTVLATYVPSDSIVGQNLGPSLPFVVLFAVLVFSPAIRRQRAVTDPLATVDPPPPGLAPSAHSRSLKFATSAAATLLLAGAVLWVIGSANGFWLLLATEAVVYSVIFLSVTVFTGMAGQISLALASFAAIGAFTTMQLADHFGMSVLLGAVIGSVLAAFVGAVLSLPVLRLGGIWLALATLAFALFFDAVLVRLSWVGGASLQQATVPRPVIGSIDFASDKNFFVLSCVVLAIVGTLVILLRGGTTGSFLHALRSSEMAAESIGIVPWRSRMFAFSLSAGIAALGGSLLAMRQGFVNYDANFKPFVGLFWLVLVVTLSSRKVQGAIQAGIGFRIFPQLVLINWLHLSPSWQFVLFGFAAVMYSKHPEGLLEHGQRRVLGGIQHLLDRRVTSRAGDPASAALPAAGGST